MSHLLKQAMAEKSMAPVGAQGEVSFDSSVALGIEADAVWTAIEQGEQVMASLESVSEQIGTTMADGGMSSSMAGMATVAIAAALDPVGMKVTTPAVESFDAAGERLQNTTFAMESIRSELENVWNAIKELVKSWMERITEFWSEHISTAGRLEKAAKALADRADDTSGSPKESKITLGKSAYRAISKDGNINLATDLSALRNLFKVSSKASGRLKVTSDQLSNIKFEKDSINADFFKAFGQKLAKGMIQDTFAGISSFEDKGDNKVEGYTGDLLGDKRIKVTLNLLSKEDSILINKNSNGAEEARHVLSANVTAVDIEKKIKYKSSYKVDSMDTGEISKVASAVADTAALVREGVDSVKDVKDEVKDINSAVDGFKDDLADLKADAKDDALKGIKILQKVIKGIPANVKAENEPGITLSRLNLDAAKAAYSFASKNLSNIKENK